MVDLYAQFAPAWKASRGRKQEVIFAKAVAAAWDIRNFEDRKTAVTEIIFNQQVKNAQPA